MNLCKDCRWLARGPLESTVTPWELRECKSPVGETVDPVSGERKTPKRFCDLERQWTGVNHCGAEGRWFEQRKPFWLRVIDAGASPLPR